MHMLILLRFVVAWAVGTQNKDYIKMCGWRKAVTEEEHRKELVAGNLADYAVRGECHLTAYAATIASSYLAQSIRPFLTDWGTTTGRGGR